MSSLRARIGWLAAGSAVLVLASSLPASALEGTVVPDGTYRFTATISDGVSHGCTGTLVAPQWILTAKDCVAAPDGPLTAVIGKADLRTSAGFETPVVRTVLNPTLELALARIPVPAVGITPPVIRTTAPAADEQLTILGYGRTSHEWVPGQLHRTTAVVSAVDSDSLTIASATAGAPTICKGDGGGPAIQDAGGVVQLVAVHVAAYQGGCLGSSSTGTDAVEARVDVAAAWIASTVRERPRTDFSYDLKPDVAGIDANNNLKLYTGDGAGKVTGGSVMLAGSTWRNFHGISAADFNGDGFADIVGIDANNDMRLYAGDGTGTVAAGTTMITGSGLWASFHGFVAGDFNGDGKADIAGIDAHNDMKLYAGDGNGRVSTGVAMTTGTALWTGFHAIAAGDFNGDGKFDIAGIDANSDMKLYAGNGAGKLSTGVAMLAGNGLWAGFQAITAGDFNSDGKTDIVGIDANSDMKLYVGNGAGKVSGGALMWPGGGQWAGFQGIA